MMSKSNKADNRGPTQENESHDGRSPSGPVMRLYRHCGYIDEATAEAHTQSLREKDLVVLFWVCQRHHEEGERVQERPGQDGLAKIACEDIC